jgi:hypothetical protein
VSEAIVKHEGAGVSMRQATDVAGVCRQIVLTTARNIQGRKYVQVEGWQSIAVAYGCVASARDVEAIAGGIRAVGEVRRMADGAVVATAEGFVGDDEPTWAKRPLYARRAMAQTRAISRACRSAFAFVVTLIDGNLSTTPAEEVPDGGFIDAVAAPVASKQEALRAKLAHVVSTVDAAAAPRPAPSSGGAVFPPFGRAKGMPIAGASMKDLEYYAAAARKSLADDSKAKWHAKEQALLDAIMDEMAAQQSPSSDVADEPPPHSDADAPF